ncbi:MAG: hydrogenase formation protein HypD [Thermodesulfobacteriota bacterium]|nr:hydrogenase formation protein HypD [Thermodesulfobacteriota bacterium]
MALTYVDEFRDGGLAAKILLRLKKTMHGLEPMHFMEICGTHTVAVFRSGLRDMLPEAVRLVSGPGCPVCVTADEDIDRAIWFARRPEVIVTSFGDLLRVPGSESSLLEERGRGADVRMVYASYEAVKIAQDHPDREVVFIGIGFETTAPTVAAAIRQATAQGIDNFSVFSVHKLLPPVMRALLDSDSLRLDGFLCPGHVTTVIGARAYEEVARGYGLPCVVTGFEPLDILQGLSMLVDQKRSGRHDVEIQYRRGVAWEGNPAAQKLLEEIFEPADAAWRGLGSIPGSGLAIRSAYADYDAARRFSIPEIRVRENPACRCGDVLRGAIRPPECPLFRKVCRPQTPKGPCMVSSEGTCGAYYRYTS